MLLLAGVAGTVSGQGTNGWNMVLNNNHASFAVNFTNNETTYYFNAATDTLFFSQGNKKPMKNNFNIEVTLKNNPKPIFTSDEKCFSADKTTIIIPVNEISIAISKTKLPSKPKFVISVKDRTVVKEKINFEFIK